MTSTIPLQASLFNLDCQFWWRICKFKYLNICYQSPPGPLTQQDAAAEAEQDVQGNQAQYRESSQAADQHQPWWRGGLCGQAEGDLRGAGWRGRSRGPERRHQEVWTVRGMWGQWLHTLPCVPKTSWILHAGWSDSDSPGQTQYFHQTRARLIRSDSSSSLFLDRSIKKSPNEKRLLLPLS